MLLLQMDSQEVKGMQGLVYYSPHHLQDLALHSASDDGDDSSNHGRVTANTQHLMEAEDYSKPGVTSAQGPDWVHHSIL